MADRENPKTHVEDQDLKAPRKQPLSPQHEGIDPLTESDTMYPATDTKKDSTKLSKKQADEPYQPDASDAANVAPEEGQAEATDAEDTTASDSTAAHEEVDSAPAEAPVNADGKLPKDAQKANKVRSDKDNTSPSNKPATPDEPTETNAPKAPTSTDSKPATGERASA